MKGGERQAEFRSEKPEKRQSKEPETRASRAATRQQQWLRQLVRRLMTSMFLSFVDPCQHSEFLN